MPTPAERLATLEALVIENRRDIDGILAAIDGGPAVEYKRSIRGRLHTMQSALEAADKLAEAGRELRRAADSQHRTRIKTWQWSVIAGCAILTAASPYVVLAFGH